MMVTCECESIFYKDGKFAGSLGMFTDITERKQVEEALLESEANRKVSEAVEVERERLNSVLDKLQLRDTALIGLSRAVCQPFLRGAIRQVRGPAPLRVPLQPHRAVRKLRNLQGAQYAAPTVGNGPARTATTTTSTTSRSPTRTAPRTSWR